MKPLFYCCKWETFEQLAEEVHFGCRAAHTRVSYPGVWKKPLQFLSLEFVYRLGILEQRLRASRSSTEALPTSAGFHRNYHSHFTHVPKIKRKMIFGDGFKFFIIRSDASAVAAVPARRPYGSHRLPRRRCVHFPHRCVYGTISHPLSSENAAHAHAAQGCGRWLLARPSWGFSFSAACY